MKDVHTEHCCVIHGCKYGDYEDCTVFQGWAPQSYLCEWCSEVLGTADETIKEIQEVKALKEKLDESK